MRTFVRDLRFAVRSLAKQPALATAAVLTLALGIGANTAIFSVVDAALLTPPPFREPGRLVFAWSSMPELALKAGLPDRLPVSNGDFFDWQRQVRSIEPMALLRAGRMTLSGRGEPEQLAVVRTSAEFFRTLGTPALLGRTLQAADEVPGRPAAVVLSHAFWQRRFAGDARVVGRQLDLDHQPLTVVGVMPPPFAFPRSSEMPAGYGFAGGPDAWVPLALPAAQSSERGGHNAVVIGRLRPGVGLVAAEKELRAVCDRLGVAFADQDKGWSAHLVPLTEQMVGNVRTALLVLWAAVSGVLLIACANVANLLLARAASRHREIAVRTAIGAGRGRLVAQLLAETVVLAFAGGALGVGLAAAGLRLLAAVVPPGVAGAATYSLDLRVLAFTVVLCLATSVLAGLVPALQMTRPNLAEVLREGGRGGAGTQRSRRTRGVLVVAEVALAVVLLVGAGLLLRSFVRLLDVDPGFRTAHLLSFEIDLPPDRVPPVQRALLYERVADRLGTMPGVVGASGISDLPLGGDEDINGYEIEGHVIVRQSDYLEADARAVLPAYVDVMGIPLRRGRLLGRGDAAGTPPVAVIDDVMARTAWPGQEALGRRFRSASATPSVKDDPKNPWVTVVGVVGSVRHSGLDAEPRSQVYRPVSQLLGLGTGRLVPISMTFVARGGGDPRRLAAAARRAVHEVDPDRPIGKLRTLDEVVAQSVAARRFNLLLLALFAGLALALAAVGIYGVTSYAVVQRTRELGLRMALGAQRGSVLRLLVREAAALAGLGLLLGLAAALALTRVMASLLYGIGSTDPLTFAAVALGLLAVALLAAYVPGRRATELDPMDALRAD